MLFNNNSRNLKGALIMFTRLLLSVVLLSTDCDAALGAYYNVTTLAGGGVGGSLLGSGSVNGVGTNALFYNPYGVALDSVGNVYVADNNNNNIRMISSGGTTTTLAGGGGNGKTSGYVNGVGTNALFWDPRALTLDSAGNVFVVATSSHRICVISTGKIVTTLAGGKLAGIPSGSANGVGTNALFFNPKALTLDLVGNIYVADMSNNIIRFISISGLVTTFAGGGVNVTLSGFANGEGTNALFNQPSGVTLDSAGNVYVADTYNNIIRFISTSGIVATFVGGGLTGTSSGSVNGEGTSALFYHPYGVASDLTGYIYVADYGNNMIRVISTAKIVTTLAGGGMRGTLPGSMNGVGTNALFLRPSGIALDVTGNVYVADSGNNKIRVLNITLQCPIGSICLGGMITTCPPGYFCPTSFTAPIPCAATGSYSPTGSSTTCAPCPSGSYCTIPANITTCPSGNYCPSSSTAPNPCATGTYSISVGASSNLTCAPCPSGSYCTIPTNITTCPPGYFCPLSSTAPLPCTAGSYTPISSRSTCLLCPPGSWTATPSSIICDQFCEPGTFLSYMGGAKSSDCLPCPQGTYANSAGASSCTSCSAGKASATIGASDASTCTKCDAGLFAAIASSTCSSCPINSYADAQQGSCLVGIFSCPLGTASISSVAPTSITSCALLTCPPPLTFAVDKSTCTGCAVNTSGVYPVCTPCAMGSICPGLTAAPLADSTFFLSTSITSCPLLTGASSLTPRLSTHTLSPGFTWLTGVLSADNAIVSGIVFASLTLLLFAAARMSSSIATAADALLIRFDAFALSVPRRFDYPNDLKPRPIGGVFTLIGGIAFATLALVLILQRAADNINIQRSVVVLDTLAAAAAAALPVFSSQPWGAGLQVRITASGDGDICASGATWSATDVGWRFTSVASCGGSAASQLIFSCADCVLSALSSISISLHYSCQSLRIEAAAMDGSGAVTAYALPLRETTAAPGSLLSSIMWTLPILLSVVNSTVSPSGRGFTLTEASHLVTSQTLTAAVGGGLAVLPTASSIGIKIALPLNTFYAVTVLSEKQSIILLFTSIVGLAGVFGFFGTLLGATDYAAKLTLCALPCARKTITGVPNEKVAEGGRGEGIDISITATDNPLRAPVNTILEKPLSTPFNTPLDAPLPAQTDAPRWRKVEDGEDTFFVCVESNATAWELPPGAVLVTDSL